MAFLVELQPLPGLAPARWCRGALMQLLTQTALGMILTIWSSTCPRVPGDIN